MEKNEIEKLGHHHQDDDGDMFLSNGSDYSICISFLASVLGGGVDQVGFFGGETTTTTATPKKNPYFCQRGSNLDIM